MLFNSLHFLVFLPIVLLLYHIIPKKLKNKWLLLASYYFYMCWNAKYAILIFISTLVTYLSGIAIDWIKGSVLDDRKKTHRKKWVVALSFGLNLAILFFFKYFNFAVDALTYILELAHIRAQIPTLDVLLPVGISFYTFQALGYTMDVYRGDIRAERNFFEYALFVSFFPQLVAGPIERSGNLLSQLASPKKLTFEDARDGLLLMIWGFFLKLVVADRIAIFVSTIYGNYQQYPGLYLVVATFLFAVQVYCDFAGYSTIAMGAAELFGIQLMDNFDAPLLSRSIPEFWNRWHISLSTWFRDYLYIPLGGNRKGMFHTYLNKEIVFFASGLWHGASMNYVFWGILNGFYLAMGAVLKPVRDGLVRLFHLNRQSLGHKLLCILTTFLLFCFGLIFVRAESFFDALEIIKSVFTDYNPWILLDGSLYSCGLDRANFMVMLLSVGILLFADIKKRQGVTLRKVIAAQDFWFRWLVIILSICAILIFGIWGSGYDSAGFIYFQF